MAVIAVVVTISLPMVRASRESSFDAASLSNLSQHARVLASYVADNKGMHPTITDPSTPFSVVKNASRDVSIEIPYFGAYYYWRVALAEQYYDGDSTNEVFFHPGGGRSRTGLREPTSLVPYWYSCSLIASADYWHPNTRRSGRGQLGATRADAVTFPSSKVTFLEPFPAIQSLSVDGASRELAAGMAMSDGSTKRVPLTSMNRGLLGDGTPEGVPTSHDLPFPPGMHTPTGVRGRD
jgi:hypothetical protein